MSASHPPAKPYTVLAMGQEVRDSLFDDARLARLAALVDLDPHLVVTDFDNPAHAEALAATEVLVTGWRCPPLTPVALARMPGLRAVVHAAGTVKGHVTDACWDRGIVVSSAAAANAVPVAEYTLAAILFSGKRVLESARAFREARSVVRPTTMFPTIGNYRTTVGIVGASRIGRRVAELLRPFDMRVLLHDPYLPHDEAAALGSLPVELDDLVRTSQVVSIHAPALPETDHLFDRRRLALMRDGAVLVNTARGSLVDTAALTEELVTGRIHAVLDVTEPEVLPADSPLWDLPNVLVTPHIAGSQGNELARLVDAAIAEVQRYTLGLPFEHAVHRSAQARSA